MVQPCIRLLNEVKRILPAIALVLGGVYLYGGQHKTPRLKHCHSCPPSTKGNYEKE